MRRFPGFKDSDQKNEMPVRVKKGKGKGAYTNPIRGNLRIGLGKR